MMLMALDPSRPSLKTTLRELHPTIQTHEVSDAVALPTKRCDHVYRGMYLAIYHGGVGKVGLYILPICRP